MAAKQLTGDTVETLLAMQGVGLAPGRGERLAQGLKASIGASLEDPARSDLEFDAEPCGFVLGLQQCRAK